MYKNNKIKKSHNQQANKSDESVEFLYLSLRDPQTSTPKQAQKRPREANNETEESKTSKARKTHGQSASIKDEPVRNSSETNTPDRCGEDPGPSYENVVCRDDMDWKRRYMLLEYKIREREEEMQKIQDADRNKNEQLKKKIEAKIRDIAILKVALNTTEEANKQLKVEVENKTKGKQEEYKQLKEQLEEKEKKIVTLQRSLDETEETLKVTKGFKQSYEKERGDNELLKRTLKDNDETITALRQKVKEADVLMNKGKTKEKEILSLKIQNAGLKEDLSKLKEVERVKLETKSIELNIKEAELVAMKQAFDTNMNELNKVKAKLNDEIKKTSQLQSSRDSVQKNYDKLSRDLKAKDRDIATLNRERQEMKSRLERECKEKNKRNQALEKAKEDLKFKLREQMGIIEKIGTLK